jgi:hypothetical protein
MQIDEKAAGAKGDICLTARIALNMIKNESHDQYSLQTQSQAGLPAVFGACTRVSG